MRWSQGRFILAVFTLFASLGCSGRSNLIGQTARNGTNSDGSGTASSAPEGLRISAPALSKTDVRRPFRAAFVAQGGSPDYAFALVDGTLPAGLSLDASGRLTGTPTESGSFAFTAQATDAAGDTATADYLLLVARHHWLETMTDFGTSSRLERALIDLLDPNTPPIALGVDDCFVGITPSFSPDGRWLLDACPEGQDKFTYLLPMDDPMPGEPRRLFDRPARSFAWAPDSSKLAFVSESGSGTDEELESLPADVFYFDTSQSEVGAERTIASLPPVSPEGIVGATRNSHRAVFERALAFPSSNLLVMSHGPNDLARVDWQGAEPSAPVLLGLGCGGIAAQSPDGERLLIEGGSGFQGLPNMTFANLPLHQSTALGTPGFITMSDTFDIAAVRSWSLYDDTISYYSVTGIQWQKVGERHEEPLWLGKRAALIAKQDRLVVLAITPQGIVEQEVPGDYPRVRNEPTQIASFLGENWIYFETNQGRDNDPERLGSTEHWLSRLQADGPSPAQLVDPDFDRRQGYNGRVDASPDHQQLLLSDFASPPLYHLVNLTDPDHIEITELDMLGLTQWGAPMWSPDSTYLGIDATDYGADPALVLDVLESPPTLRKLECSTDSLQRHCSFPHLFQR